jgi:hypothetical protein
MGYSNIECGNVVVIAHPPFILRSPPRKICVSRRQATKTRVLLNDSVDQKYVIIKDEECRKRGNAS